MSATTRVRAFWKVHPLFGAVFLVELLFVVALAAGALRPLAVCTVPSDALTQTEDGSLCSAPLTLSSGGYRVTVTYRATFPQEPQRVDGNTVATLTFASDKNPAAVQSDAIILTDTFSAVTARLWIGTATTVEDLVLTVTPSPAEGQTFALESITLQEQPVWRVVSLVKWLLLFVVVDGLLILLFLGEGPRAPRCGWAVPALLAGGILLASLPYCTDFLYVGHDLRFHCFRIWALGQSLAEGQFPVRMLSAGFNGYGDAASLYYCDLFLYLPALLYNAFLPLQTCYQIYVVLVNTATMLIAYYSFARIGQDKTYGAVAAFAYTLGAYRLTVLLLRAAVGEYTAMAFLPLVVQGAWAIARAERPRARDWLPLALGMAGIVQSHLLTAELAGLFLVLFWLCNGHVMLRPRRLAATGKAAALAVGLSAWFLVPFLDEMGHEYIMISDVHSDPIQSSGTYLMQLFSLFGYPSGTSGWSTNGVMPLTLGAAGVTALVLALVCCLLRRQWYRTTVARLQWLGLRGGLALCLLAAWLSSTAFPWDWITSKMPEKLAEILRKPQFAWRYLDVALVLLGVIAVLALALLNRARPRWAQYGAAALVVATLLYTGIFYRDYMYNQSPVTMVSVESLSDCPYESMGYEYLPAGTDLSLFRKVEATASDPAASAQWLGRRTVRCTNPTGNAVTVQLPLLAYRGYRAVDTADGTELALAADERHCLQLTLPSGYSGTVQVRYAPLPAWRIAEAISLLTLLGLVGAAVRSVRRTRRPAKPSIPEEEPAYV